nr:uncharacterized protein C14orf132 isoform X1 [Misgurnus anguillicaudatus]
MELSLIAAQHFQAVSGAFMDSPCNDNSSHQTSTSNLNANFSRPAEQEEEGKFSSDAIWLWVAVIATIGNIVVVAVVVCLAPESVETQGHTTNSTLQCALGKYHSAISCFNGNRV